MFHLTHYRVFDVKFIGPTNSRGARVSIADTRSHKRRYIPYCYETGDILAQADKYLAEEKGIKCEGFGSTLNQYWLFTTNFESAL